MLVQTATDCLPTERAFPMKLQVTGFKAEPDQESFDHIYFFKATMSGEELFFELTNDQIGQIIDEGDYKLPEPFDFGAREPTICQLLVWMHQMYWRDEDGCLKGASIEMTRPSGV